MKFLFQIKDWNLLKLKFKNVAQFTYLWQLLEFTGKLCNHWQLLVSVVWISLENCQKFSEEFCIFIFLSFYVHRYSYNAEHTVKDCLTVTSSLWPLFLPPSKTATHFLVKKTLLIESICFGPLVTILMAFHCLTEKLAQYIA